MRHIGIMTNNFSKVRVWKCKAWVGEVNWRWYNYSEPIYDLAFEPNFSDFETKNSEFDELISRFSEENCGFFGQNLENFRRNGDRRCVPKPIEVKIKLVRY